jgi:predicted nucleic acid-binding protein
VYTDASALVKLVVVEYGSDPLAARVSGCRLVCSALGRVEVIRAVRRVGVDEQATEALLDRVTFQRVEPGVLERASAVDPPELGSLDAIHLATALLFAPELDVFITYDRQLGRAAQAAGLTVEAPGASAS